MPVIREQRQFSIAPIGVNRASKAGAITGEAIARSADQINGLVYKRAAENAEKLGVEQAKSVANEMLIGIDPATGAPTALSNIKGMGRIQSEAYERIVNRRFEESMEQELILKSKELAMKHENPATYETLMSDYLAEMSNNATGQYQEYINNTGAVYLNKTKLALQDLAIRKAKAAQKAAEAKANAERESLAFSVGRNAAIGDAGASMAQFGALLGLSDQSGEDVATFTGDASVSPENRRKLSASFLSGYAPSALVALSPEDRTQLRVALQFGAPVKLSMAGQNVYNTIKKVAGNDPAMISKLGEGLASEITFLNSVPTEADLNIKSFVKGYVEDNKTLALQVEDQSFYKSGYSDIISAYNSLEAFPVSPTDPVSKDDYNARLAKLAGAQDQVLSASIMKHIDSISGLSEEDFANIQNGLKSKSLEPLFELNPSIPEEHQNIMRDLMSKAEPKTALSALESMKTWQGGIESRQNQAANNFIKSKLPDLEAQILDGVPFDQVALELSEGGDGGSDYQEALQKLKDANGIVALRGVLTDYGLEEGGDAMLNEVKMLASGAAVDDDATPILNAKGIRPQIEKLLNGISNVDARKASVNSVLEVLPKDRSADLRAEANNAYKTRVDELSTGTLSRKELLEARDKLATEINGDSRLLPDEKSALIKEADESVGLSVIGEVMSSLTNEEVDQAVAYITTPTEPNNLTQDVKDQLDSAMSPFTSEADRGTIASKVSGLSDRLKKSRAAIEAQNQASAVISAIEGGGSIPDAGSEQTRETAEQYILQSNNLTALPSDLFTNTPALIAASNNPDDPRHKEGLATRDYLELSTRILMPETERFLRAGLRGGTYAGRPVDIENFSDVIFNIAANQDPVNAQRTRTEILSSSGFSVEEVGILEGISRARLAGVPSEYLDDVAASLRDGSRNKETLQASLGGKTVAEFVMEASDMWVGGGRLTADLGVQTEMQDYALGLFKSGMQPKQIRDTLRQHMSTAYYTDTFTLSPSSHSKQNVRVGLERAFPREVDRTAALQLFQVDLYAQLGKNVAPKASLEEQIQAGKTAYGQQNQSSFVSAASNLGTQYAKKAGEKSVVFIPSYNSTNQNARFTAYLQNDYGEIEFIEGAPSISTADPRVSKLAATLEASRKAENLNDVPWTQWPQGRVDSIEDTAIQFYLENSKP